MNPQSQTVLVERAVEYQKNGDHAKACVIYSGLMRRGHATARILANYGAAIYEQGDKAKALEYFKEALAIDPAHQNAWDNLLIHANATNEWDLVLKISEKIIDSSATNKRAHCAKAKALMAAGSFSTAQLNLVQLLESDPDDLELRELIARCHLACSDLDSALGHLLYIISIKPGDAFASIELSEIAAKAGDLESSMAILESAQEINPEDIRIILKIAREYQACGRMHEAISKYELALSIDPDRPEALASMAYCFSEIGEISKFFVIYDSLIERKVMTPEMLVPIIFICSIQGEEYLDKLRKYSSMYWGFFNGQTSGELAPLHVPSRAPQGRASSVALPLSRGVHRRKIGIVTGGLGTHVESCFLASFLLNYSKDLLAVEVVSNRWMNDGVSDVLSRAVDRCHSISDLSPSAARELIQKQEYDVIIETTGFTSGSAIDILSHRCAPVQCHWIGYHASTFMPTMDYFIGDSVLVPEAHSDRFSEQVVRLKRAWLAATPFTMIPEANAPNGDEVIFGSFSQIAKLTTKTLGLWTKILLATPPRCKLLLKDKFTNDPVMVSNLLAFFASQGVDPERIILKPRTNSWFEHMAMYNLIDVALDTTPWSSATTAFDTLSMGVPLISIKGQTTSGLMSSSVLHHCGKQAWIAHDEAEFIEKNLSLVEGISALRQGRRELQSEILTSQLFDGQGMARAIESFVLGA